MTADIRWGTFLHDEIGMDGKTRRDYLVKVPAGRERVIPSIDSIKEDSPSLWEPITTILGKSISAPTLCENENMSQWWSILYDIPSSSYTVGGHRNPTNAWAWGRVG